MIGSEKLIAFVGVRDPVRAKSFYQGILGLPLVSEDPFALAFDANGTMLRVSVVPEPARARYTVLGWEVSDIVETAKRLTEAGIKLERFEGLAQDPMAIWTAPGGARVAWFKDPDENMLSITEF